MYVSVNTHFYGSFVTEIYTLMLVYSHNCYSTNVRVQIQTVTLFFTCIIGPEYNFRASLNLRISRLLIRNIFSPYTNRRDAIEQGSANFFCEGPDSKHFGLCRSYTVSVTTTQFCCCNTKGAMVMCK